MSAVAASAAALRPPWRWVWAFALPERRERLRLTFAGYTLCAAAAALAAAAYNNASNVLFLALALTLSMFGLNLALAWANLFKLEWTLPSPGRARAGVPAIMRVSVRNGRRALPAYALRFEFHSGDGVVKTVRLREPLEAGETRDPEAGFTPARRGLLRPAVLGVTSSHPFALMHKTRVRPVFAEMLVWPARTAYSFGPGGGRRLRFAGDRPRRGEGMELIGLREYRPGDPPRSIHWKVSAKRGRLVVRETSEPAQSGYALWLDEADFLAAPAAWEKAVSCAASLAEDLWGSGRLEAAGVAPAALAPTRRPGDLHAFLDALARLPAAPRAGVAPVAPPSEALRFLPGPGDVVHVVHRQRIVGEA